MKKIIEKLQKEGKIEIQGCDDKVYILMELKSYCKDNNIQCREFITTQTVEQGDYYMGSSAPVTFTFALQGITIDNKPYILNTTEDNKAVTIDSLKHYGYDY